MASTDAKPFPIKNTAYRVTLPILDADGDLVTGATGLDSEVSKDGGTFTDCTNEATEIATASGMYYLDLSSTEMNADTVAIIVKTSSSGAKTTALVLYPLETGDIPDVAAIKAKTDNLPTDPADASDITAQFATVNSNITTVAGYVDTEVAAIKAKTDALPTDPADASDIAASFATVNTSLSTLSGYVDTEVAAIKAKTDQLIFTSGTVNANATIALAAGDLADISAAILKHDWTTVSGEAAYSVLQALRMLRNEWNTATGTLSVYKEDGSTLAWQRTLTTDPSAEPITGAS